MKLKQGQNKKKVLVYNNYKKDEYKYGIMARYSGCNNVKVATYTLQLKKYNPYADNQLCKGNEEFVL